MARGRAPLPLLLPLTPVGEEGELSLKSRLVNAATVTAAAAAAAVAPAKVVVMGGFEAADLAASGFATASPASEETEFAEEGDRLRAPSWPRSS